MRPLALVALGALALPACFYPADRGRALEVKIEKLTRDSAELHSGVDQANSKIQAAMPKIDEKIAEVEKALKSMDKAARRSDADIGVQMQKAVEDVSGLRGQVETYLHRIDDLDAQLKKLAADTDQRITTLQGQEAAREAEAKKKAEELKRPSNPKDFLALANAKAAAGEVPLSRQLYAELLKSWPKDPLAADAHLALGESYRAEDKCREALFEYRKVIEEFEKSKAAAPAYLQSADCFEKLKMKEEAKLALEELVKGFPKSPEAKEGKVKLAELQKVPKPAPKPAPKGKGK